MTFGTEIGGVSQFAGSRRHLKQIISNLQPAGRASETKLYEALDQALDLLSDDALPENRRVLVISDGKDEGSSVRLENVVAKAEDEGIPIDAVAVGRIDPQFAASLEGLAAATGGYFVHTQPDGLTLKEALHRVDSHVTETQPRVAHFKHEAPEGAKMTETVGILLQRPDGEPLSHNIPAQVPRSGIESRWRELVEKVGLERVQWVPLQGWH